MKTTTKNLQIIANIAINLLNIPITKKDINDFGIVHHPFFNSTIIPANNKLIDIFKDTEDFKKYVKDLENHIYEQDNIFNIIFLINRPYSLFFFSLIQKYLSEDDFNILLKELYTETEFPNRDVNVPVEEIRKMFEKANKKLLMDADELKIFNKLENELTIYRGFYSNEYYNALSWTLDKEKAHFFATRFSGNGSIYQANIKKEDIYAYFNCRNEKELIVNYDKLYNIAKIEQFN